MNTQHCIEIASFRLKPEVTDDQMVALEQRIRSGHIQHQSGYLGRELGKDSETGEWLMILRFETRAQMDAWMSALKGSPDMRELASMMEPGSLRMRFFTHML